MVLEGKKEGRVSRGICGRGYFVYTWHDDDVRVTIARIQGSSICRKRGLVAWFAACLACLRGHAIRGWKHGVGNFDGVVIAPSLF